MPRTHSALLLATLAAALWAARPASSSAPSTAAVPGVSASGERLVASLGCGGCHAGLPVDPAARRAPPLDDVGSRLAPEAIFAYLGSARAAPAGRPRMPDYRLDEAERLALALYLARQTGEGGPRARADGAARSAFRAARERHPRADARLGARAFVALNCAACHTRSPARAWPNAPPLALEGERADPRWLRAWLRDPAPVRPFGFHPGSGSRMPDFGLSAVEADSIAAFLLRGAPAAPPAPRPAPLSPFAARKVEALLRDRLPCLGCHQLDGEGGRIGPDLSDVGARRRPEWIRQIIHRPQHVAPGTPMPAIEMPPATRELITRYLQGRARPAPAAPPLSLADHPVHFPTGGAEARVLYRRMCASCHGVDGLGDGYNARYLPVPPTAHAEGRHMALRPDDTLYDGIHAGGAVLGKSQRMPPFGQTLRPAQLRALVAYLRELCSCRGPAWARDGAAEAVR